MCFLSVNSYSVLEPLGDSPQETTALMHLALDLGVGEWRGDKLRLCYQGFGKIAQSHQRRLFRPLLCHATYQNYETDKTKGGPHSN